MDVSALSEGLRSGTAVYLYRLCEALGALGEDLDLDLLYNGQGGRGEELARSLQRERTGVLSRPLLWKPLPAPLFWRPYPRELTAAAHRADLFHVGEFVYPRVPMGHPVTATVHDCTTVLFPEWHGWANRLLHRRRFKWIGAHATRVIIDAEATRSDTAGVLGRPPGTLDVIPLARGTSMASAPVPTDVRNRYQLGDGPIVLFVGTLEPRKNLVRLVEAFGRLPERHRGATLVLAGHMGWRGGALRRRVASTTPRCRRCTGRQVCSSIHRCTRVSGFPCSRRCRRACRC